MTDILIAYLAFNAAIYLSTTHEQRLAMLNAIRNRMMGRT